MMLALSLLTFYPAIFGIADATHFPLIGRLSPGRDRRTLARRTTMNAEGLTNSNDVEYFTNVTLGGAPYVVQIDTGRSV
jgi:hypothetical protein